MPQTMRDTCPECGAAVLPSQSCQSNFHALLYREAEVAQSWPDYFATGEGQSAHFLAVSCYAIQHPQSMGYTVEALIATRDNVAQHLEGIASVASLRSKVHKIANGAQRVLRREGDVVHDWGVRDWPLNVQSVLDAPLSEHAAAVRRWAQTMMEAIQR